VVVGVSGEVQSRRGERRRRRRKRERVASQSVCLSVLSSRV